MSALLAYLLLAGIGAWLLGLPAVRLLARRHACPVVQRRRTLLAAALPFLAPVSAVTGLLLVAAAKAQGLIDDHCVQHGPGHAHLCLRHLPSVLPGSLALVLGAIALAVLSTRVVRGSIELWKQDRQLAALSTLATGRGPLRWLDHVAPTALVAGIREPRVLLSRSLRPELSSRERRIVVAHELAHLRHRDPAWSRMIEVLLLFHLPGSANRLRSRWRGALEAIADDAVARRFGRLDTAATLVRVARVARTPDWQLSVAGADPIARARRLLRPEHQSAGKQVGWLEGCLLAGVASLLPIAFGAHHALETVLGMLP